MVLESLYGNRSQTSQQVLYETLVVNSNKHGNDANLTSLEAVLMETLAL